MRLTWIYGPPAVGKSVTGWQLYQDLAGAGGRCAYVDIDQLGMCYPEPDGDLDRFRLKARALAALAGVREAEDYDDLVVSGVVDPALRAWHDALLGRFDLRWCRLTAPDDELLARLEARGPWGTDAAPVLAEAHALAAADLPDPVVSAHAGRTVADVAADVAAEVDASVCVEPPTAYRRSRTDVGPAPGAVSGTPREPGSALWLAGATGVGKSAVGWEVYLRLQRLGRAAFLDAQQLGFVAGVGDDVWNVAPETGLAVVWPVLRDAGATRLVVSGTREPGSRPPAEVLAPTATRVVHLEASGDALAERVAARGRGEGVRLAGDDLLGRPEDELAAVAVLAAARGSDLGTRPEVDVRVDTTGRTPAQLAEVVLRAL